MHKGGPFRVFHWTFEFKIKYFFLYRCVYITNSDEEPLHKKSALPDQISERHQTQH